MACAKSLFIAIREAACMSARPSARTWAALSLGTIRKSLGTARAMDLALIPVAVCSTGRPTVIYLHFQAGRTLRISFQAPEAFRKKLSCGLETGSREGA